MTCHVGILGSSESPYARQLERAAPSISSSITTEFIDFGELGCRLDADQLKFPWDAVIVRSMPLGSLEQVIFRMDLLRVFESAGVLVMNSPECLEVAIDKWLTLLRLREHSVDFPATIACQTRDAALEAFQSLGEDVVVKPLFGGEGRGIVRVQDSDMAWRVFSTLQQLRSVIYVQEFHPHLGYDIRVLIVGEQAFAIRRQAPEDSWKTNLSQGSSAEPYELSDSERELAFEAARAVGGECGRIVGVDLLPCQDGRLRVLEVNAVPGWRGVNQVYDIDIAQVVMQYIQELVALRSPRRLANA